MSTISTSSFFLNVTFSSFRTFFYTLEQYKLNLIDFIRDMLTQIKLDGFHSFYAQTLLAIYACEIDLGTI